MKTHIIKKNSLIKELPGYRKIILLLKSSNIYKWFGKNKEINIGEYTREIIELKKYDNKILVLLENSTLKQFEKDKCRDIIKNKFVQ